VLVGVLLEFPGDGAFVPSQDEGDGVTLHPAPSHVFNAVSFVWSEVFKGFPAFLILHAFYVTRSCISKGNSHKIQRAALCIYERLNGAWYNDPMQFLNKRFFRFLVGFLSILAFSVSLTLLVQKYESTTPTFVSE
jgi:hypothetical protein